MNQLQNIKSAFPYNDKWKPDNKYHHVLFRHGDHVSLQAGELNEIQSILQEQLKHSGDHIFKNGSIIIPGSIQVIENQQTIQIELLTNIPENIIKGNKVKHLDGSLNEIIVTNKLNSKALDIIVSGNVENFNEDEIISIIDDLGEPIASGYVVKSGYTTYSTIESGILYVNGYFIRMEGDIIIPTWYNKDKSGYIIGLTLSNNVITEEEDINLYSNVQGYPDVRSAGAHRLEISTKIVTYTKNEFINTKFLTPYSFIKLIEIDSNNKQLFIKVVVEYNSLETYLAKRTYEESGHYIVKHPKYLIREHLKSSTTNKGRFISTEGGDLNKLSFGIKPWLGYIYGNRTDIQKTTWIDIKKPVDIFKYNNVYINKIYTDFIPLNLIKGIPFLNEVNIYDIHNNLLGYSSIIMTVKRNDIFNICLTDIIQTFNLEEEIIKLELLEESIPEGLGIPQNIKSRDGRFEAILLSNIPNGSLSNSLSKIPYKNMTGVSDVSMTTLDEMSANTNNEGLLTINSYTQNDYFDKRYEDSIILSYEENNILYEITSSYNIEYVERQIIIDLGSLYSNKKIVGLYPVRHGIVDQKIITKSTKIEEINFSSITNKDILFEEVDVININSIKIIIDENVKSEDIKNKFNLISSNKNTLIVPSILKYIYELDLECKLEIKYDYNDYNQGDFTSINSYLETPNKFGANDLTTFIDMRRVMDKDGLIVNNSISPIHDSLIQIDVNIIQNKSTSICINKNNEIFALDGISTISTPNYPIIPNDSIKLFDITIPGKYESFNEIEITPIKYPRYTMRDISSIEDRVSNLEYYTSLSMLELTTSTYEVLDPVLGIPRYKNGFAVSNFKDFSVLNPNKFQAGISVVNGGIHPMTISHPKSFKDITLSSGLVKRGDIVLLDYDSIPFISQKIATSSISVNPYSVFVWKGSMKISPNTNFWHDTLYEDTSITLNESRQVLTAPAQNIVDRSLTNTTISTNDILIRTEINNTIRPINIHILIEAVKPLTKYTLLFDDINVNELVTPKDMQKGTSIISDRQGKCNLLLEIPNSNDNMVFPTGISKLSLLSDKQNDIDDPSAFAFFESGGETTVRQLVLNVETINIEVQPRPAIDPIAESFYINNSPIFASQIGLYFNTKHNSVPVRVQIRPLINGTVANGPIKNAEKILYPDDIVTSIDASEETIFEFSRPVYLPENNEYAIVVLSDSDEYTVFKSTIGEAPINSQGAPVDKQPFIGVFFKSQNGSTWTEDQMTDLAFTLYRAKFKHNEEECLLPFSNTIKNARNVHFQEGITDLVINYPGHYLHVNEYIICKTDIDSLNNVNLIVTEIIDGNSFKVLLPNPSTMTKLVNNFIFESKLTYNSIRVMLDSFNSSTAKLTTSLHTKELYSNNSRTYNINNSQIDLNNKLVATTESSNYLNVKFNTLDDKVSPMLNVSSTGVICFDKIINDDINNPIMYAETIPFQFKNAFNNATLLFSAKLPESANLKVEYKVLNSIYDSAESYEWKDTGLKSINNETHSKQLLSINNYLEYEVDIEEEGMNAIIIKFSFSSNNSSDIELKDFRIIGFL